MIANAEKLAGKDLNVAGSTIVGTNDVNLAAANNVNITTTQNTLQSNSSYQEHHSGFATSGLTVSLGTSSQSQNDQQSSVTNNGSTIGSLNGNVNVSAGNNLHVTGSEIYANQDTNLAAKSVTIDSAYDTSTQAEQQSSHPAGITVGISNAVVSAVQMGILTINPGFLSRSSLSLITVDRDLAVISAT